MKRIFFFITLIAFTFNAIYAQDIYWSDQYANNGTGNLVWSMYLDGNSLYVGGDFMNAGGVFAERAGELDINTDTWADRASGWGGFYVDVVVVDGAGNAYIGGFNWGGILKWNGAGSWTTLDCGVNDVGFGPLVDAAAINGNNLYVGGSFIQAGCASIPVANLAKYDIGTNTWSKVGNVLGEGANNVVSAIAINAVGDEVYVGGAFTQVGGTVSANYIAKWHVPSTTWITLGGGTNGKVEAITIDGTNMYVGGNFTQVDGGTSANYLAKWDGSSWTEFAGGTNGIVRTIAVSGTDVYIGGDFTQVGGSVSANYIAKWDGSSWSALGSGTNLRVRTIVVIGSVVYAGGNFTTAGLKTNNFIAKYAPFPLPIGLLSFKATPLDNNTVQTKWSTGTELNNNYFTVERSIDGVNFDNVTLVDGAGNSNSTLYYSVIDENPYEGLSYYRLKQTDFDGKFTYSDVVSVSMYTNKMDIIRLFPNPAANLLGVEFYSTENTDVTVRIFNTLGEKVYEKRNFIKTGLNQISCDINSLGLGSYVIKVVNESDGYQTHKQFIKNSKR